MGEALERAILKSFRSGLAATNRLILKFDDRSPFRINYNLNDIRALLNFRTEAFTVAGVGIYELEQRLKQLALELQTDTSIKDPIKEFGKRSRVIIAEYVPQPNGKPTGWLETNMRTAINSSLAASQYSKLTDDSALILYPYWQYMTQRDDKVREAHARLHGGVYSNRDPVWNVIYPPNDWNCRCYVNPLRADEIQGLDVQELVTEEEALRRYADEVGPDFRRNPGKTGSIWSKWLSSKLREIDTDEVYRMMTGYAGAFRQSDVKINKTELKHVRESFGLYSDRKTRDHANYPVNINSDPERSSIIESVIKKPNEVWGVRKANGHVLHYIQYTQEGLLVVKVVDGTVGDVFTASAEKLGEYRVGNLMTTKNG